MRSLCVLSAILGVFSLQQALAVPIPQQEDNALVITASVDRNQITVGDPFLYLVIVNSPWVAAVQWPEAGRVPGGFELVSFEHAGPTPGSDSTNIDSLRYELTLYRTGDHTIPPFALSCILPNGTEISTTSDSIPITVVSVLDDDASDIRDLKAPVQIPDEAPWYWWLIGGLVLLAVTAVAILYFKRRRVQDVPSGADSAIKRSPAETALDELDRLECREWLEQGRVKAHYSALSEIIRRYLATRYCIAAMEYTTTELIASLNSLELGREETLAIRILFEECDMVKFARFTPEALRQSLSVQESRNIVVRTRPAEPAGESNVNDASVKDERFTKDETSEARSSLKGGSPRGVGDGQGTVESADKSGSPGENPGSVKDRTGD